MLESGEVHMCGDILGAYINIGTIISLVLMVTDESALASLELAFEENAATLFTFNWRAWWKDLLPHPRAQAILRKMNLVK